MRIELQRYVPYGITEYFTFRRSLPFTVLTQWRVEFWAEYSKPLRPSHYSEVYFNQSLVYTKKYLLFHSTNKIVLIGTRFKIATNSTFDVSMSIKIFRLRFRIIQWDSIKIICWIFQIQQFLTKKILVVSNRFWSDVALDQLDIEGSWIINDDLRDPVNRFITNRMELWFITKRETLNTTRSQRDGTILTICLCDNRGKHFQVETWRKPHKDKKNI